MNRTCEEESGGAARRRYQYHTGELQMQYRDTTGPRT